MPKAYITAPFTEKSVIKDKEHVYGEIKEQSFINFLNTIESVLREFGFSTFLPHRDIHQWGKIYIEPEIVMKQVLKEIKECDLFITCPEYSKGPNVELGMAIALGKKAVIIQNENEKLSLVHAGLKGLSPTSIIRFKDIMDMKDKLRRELSASTGIPV
ncbi:MAG: hypothetical protein HYT70_01055 [Candidatus Aenigmarchaeota archaeon]|nr:hypothetical protein [Candidatus Aenigmarchaeota archaeon]